MPGVPTFTIAEASNTYHPVDTLVLRSHGQPSILDTVFVSKRSRRAVYATTTYGPRTSLWRVAASGSMTEIARMDWEYEVKATSAGDGSLQNSSKPSKRRPMLTFGGKMIRTEEFLQKGRGWFSGDSSRVFSVTDTEYKWKSGAENDGISDSQHTWSHTSAYQEVWKIWRCVAPRPSPSINSPTVFGTPFSPPYDFAQLTVEPPRVADTTYAVPAALLGTSSSGTICGRDTEPRSPSSTIRSIISPILNAPAPATVLARFAPPQIGLVHNEISLFPPLFPSPSNLDPNPQLLEYVLVSAVILAAAKGEWKHIQSTSQPSALQAVFVAEALGEVPPYTPGAGPISATGPPTTVQNGAYPGGLRRANQFPMEAREHVIVPSTVEDSDRTPLLPRRSTHRASRSNPFNPFPTPPFNIRPRIRSNSARTSDPRHVAHGSLPVRRPITVESSPAGDGVFCRRRPPLQTVNAAPVGVASRRPSTAGMIPPPMISAPPAYK